MNLNGKLRWRKKKRNGEKKRKERKKRKKGKRGNNTHEALFHFSSKGKNATKMSL